AGVMGRAAPSSPVVVGPRSVLAGVAEPAPCDPGPGLDQSDGGSGVSQRVFPQMVGDLARVVVAPEFRGEEGVDLTSGEGFQFQSVPLVSSGRTFLRGGEPDDHARGTFGASA